MDTFGKIILILGLIFGIVFTTGLLLKDESTGKHKYMDYCISVLEKQKSIEELNNATSEQGMVSTTE